MRLKGMLALALDYPATPQGYANNGVRGVPKVGSVAFWDRVALDVCRAFLGLDCLYVDQQGRMNARPRRPCKLCLARKGGLCNIHSPEKRGRGYRSDLHEEGKKQKDGKRVYHVGTQF